MPAYLIEHPKGQREDVLIEDPELALTFQGDWAIFSDTRGPSFAIPAERGATIRRIDPDTDGNTTSNTIEGPAPQE